jgi:hypothetical protein
LKKEVTTMDFTVVVVGHNVVDTAFSSSSSSSEIEDVLLVVKI